MSAINNQRFFTAENSYSAKYAKAGQKYKLEKEAHALQCCSLITETCSEIFERQGRLDQIQKKLKSF